MTNSIKELFNLEKFYLHKILNNIPDELLYASDKKAVNSPGWILGHLIVEVEGLSSFLKVNQQKLPQIYIELFKGDKSQIESSTEKPSKQELLELFTARYDLLLDKYMSLTEEERSQSHPSKMFANIYSNIDSLVCHMLITHVSVHAGNIVAWKQMHGLDPEGF